MPLYNVYVISLLQPKVLQCCIGQFTEELDGSTLVHNHRITPLLVAMFPPKRHDLVTLNPPQDRRGGQEVALPLPAEVPPPQPSAPPHQQQWGPEDDEEARLLHHGH